jgi:hypothetical protein
MNTLIMLSFFAVAVLAFIVALWLAYAEKQEMLAKASLQAAPASPAAPVNQAAPVEKEVSLITPALQMPLKDLSSLKERSLPLVSSGQLYELALELRALQNQASEINERLRVVSLSIEQQLEQSARYLYIQEQLAV